MLRSFFLGIVCSLLVVACTTEAQDQSQAQSEQEVRIADEGPDHHLLYQPGEIDWQPGPGSFEEGSEFAILEGDPSEEGVFTMRIRMPDGFHISPHWHPNVERVTVISGTFLLGSGEEFNPDATERLETGSYTSMPPEMVHYAIAEGETVIQLTSVGPWLINYVNEEDDPRLTD